MAEATAFVFFCPLLESLPLMKDDPSDVFMRCEIFRQQGRFEAALEVLEHVPRPLFASLIDQFKALCAAVSVGSKPGTCSRGTRRPRRFSIRRKWASVAALTKLTASPAAPARAVRPMRCT